MRIGRLITLIKLCNGTIHSLLSPFSYERVPTMLILNKKKRKKTDKKVRKRSILELKKAFILFLLFRNKSTKSKCSFPCLAKE